MLNIKIYNLFEWIKKNFKNQENILTLVFFLFWFGYFSYFWVNAMNIEKTGEVIAYHLSIWGDWAAHFTMGSAMAYRSLILTESPFLINAQFSYPFVSNLLAALVVKLNVNFFLSFIITSFLFSITFIASLWYLFMLLFKSKTIAVLACLIFLFNGGLGFIEFFSDIKESEQPMEVIINPPRQYTHITNDNQIHWISVINSQIIPQRSLTLGIPYSIVILVLIYLSLFGKKKNSKKVNQTIFNQPKLQLSAVMYGFLPIIHAHSFIAINVILFCWALADLSLIYFQKGFKSLINRVLYLWLGFALISAIILIPVILNFIYNNASNSGFFRWWPGWYQRETPEIPWLYFWFKNWGMTPFLALIGFFSIIRSHSTFLKRIFTFWLWLPFFILFILLNLFLFQPHAWDNTKILLWSSIGISGLTAYTFVSIWQKFANKNYANKISARIIVVTLIFFTILSGGIDAWRILRFDMHRYSMYSAEEIELVEWVKKHTSIDSIWLTGDQHNHWLYNLTGRQPLLTFRGWLWTHGYNYSQVERDVSIMFENPNRMEVFLKYNISYVVIGHNEKEVWNANLEKYLSLYQVIKESENYLIFKIE